MKQDGGDEIAYMSLMGYTWRRRQSAFLYILCMMSIRRDRRPTDVHNTMVGISDDYDGVVDTCLRPVNAYHYDFLVRICRVDGWRGKLELNSPLPYNITSGVGVDDGESGGDIWDLLCRSRFQTLTSGKPPEINCPPFAARHSIGYE